MSLDRGPLESITGADLQALADDQVCERKTLEYKRDLPGGPDSEKREFLRDVASFANTSGGHIVYGIREENGAPVELCGVSIVDRDSATLRLENMLRDGLRPRLSGFEFAWVSLPNRNHALVIRIPSSWAKPHMTVLQQEGKFWARNTNGKYAMDVDEVRVAFLSSGFVSERAKEFRLSRVNGKEPRNLGLDTPPDSRFVLHVLPFSAFAGGAFVDLSGVECDQVVRQWFFTTTSRIRYDLEGVEFCTSSSTRRLTVFREGNVELLDRVPIDAASSNAIFEMELESGIIRVLPDVLRLQQRLGLNPPFIVFLSLTGVRGCHLNITLLSNRWGNGHKIEKDPLLIPGVRIESFNTDASLVLRPIFDGVWLAAGWPRSMDYDNSGQRVGWFALDR